MKPEDFDLYFILDDERRVVPAPYPEFTEWWQRHGGKHRIVAQSLVGPVLLSTLFFGMDMNIARIANPLLAPLVFETALMGPSVRKFMPSFTRRASLSCWSVPAQMRLWRYATWDDAAAGHAAIRARLPKPGPCYMRRMRSTGLFRRGDD